VGAATNRRHLVAHKEPARYERAALRLHARLTKDLRLGLDDSLALLGLLVALRGRRAKEAAHALASFRR
jgi:hypothetical protein